MKTAKKTLMYTSLATLAVCIILLISSLFGLKTFEGALLKVLETCATIAIAGFFAMNALTMTEKNKVMGYVCAGLLGFLSLLLIIIFWTNIPWGLFQKLVFVLTIATILFNIIVNLNLKLDKNLFVLQIVTYVLIGIIDIILTMVIFGSKVLTNSTVLKLFVAGCIIVFGLLCALGILGKKVEKTPMPIKQGELNDVDSLKAQVRALQEENARLREQLSKYENQK